MYFIQSLFSDVVKIRGKKYFSVNQRNKTAVDLYRNNLDEVLNRHFVYRHRGNDKRKKDHV